jgi:hypothetical protein
LEHKNMAHQCCGPGYESPQAAMTAEREQLLYTLALYTVTGIQEPDYLATIDSDSMIQSALLLQHIPYFLSVICYETLAFALHNVPKQ